MPDPETNPVGSRSLSAYLKENKEVIATVSFFLGGSLWVLGYFATKDQLKDAKDTINRQIKEIQCLMNTNINVIDGKMQSSNYQNLLIKSYNEISALRNKKKLSAEENSRLNELQIGVEQLTKKLTQIDTLVADDAKILSSGNCIIEIGSN